MAIVAHQVTYRGGSDGNVPAITDRRLYDFLLSNSTGVVEGLTPAPSSSGEYKFSAGWGFIQGCMFTVDNTLSVEMLATSSDTASRVIARLNVALSTIEFEEQLQPYPALVQEDILHNGSIYEVVMARFSLNGRNVSAATLEMPMLVGMAEYATELTALRALVDPAVAKLATIEEGAQVNTVTGVKGTKESSYRTGNVSLTPANIGAVPLSAVNTDNTTVDYYLNTTWANYPNGVSLLNITEDASINLRYTAILNKVSNTTGSAFIFDMKSTSVNGVLYGKSRVMIKNSDTYYVYTSYLPSNAMRDLLVVQNYTKSFTVAAGAKRTETISISGAPNGYTARFVSGFTTGNGDVLVSSVQCSMNAVTVVLKNTSNASVTSTLDVDVMFVRDVTA